MVYICQYLFTEHKIYIVNMFVISKHTARLRSVSIISLVNHHKKNTTVEVWRGIRKTRTQFSDIYQITAGTIALIFNTNHALLCHTNLITLFIPTVCLRECVA